jgi:hypothetical protein
MSLKGLLTAGIVLLLWNRAEAQLQKSPADVTAALLIKVAAFEKNLNSSGDISIYVMDAPEVAAELQKGIGNAIGKSCLTQIESGADLPTSKPSILFVGSSSNVEKALEYTHSNKILSATGNPDLVEEGISLGLGIGEDEKPKILLNLNNSVNEGVDWNPAILKIARTIKK